MYHATQALLSLKDLNTKTRKGIIQMFGQHFIKTGIFPIELARALSDAYDMRRLSDYEETIFLSSEQSEIILNSARSFIEQAVQYCENYHSGCSNIDRTCNRFFKRSSVGVAHQSQCYHGNLTIAIGEVDRA